MYSSLLAIDLLGALEVPASLLYIPSKGEKVQVICTSDCNKADIVPKLDIETGSIEEEENRSER